MWIYKGPKILIFHLKRFKSGSIVYKNKIESLIDFPIDGLDLTDFLLNPELP